MRNGRPTPLGNWGGLFSGSLGLGQTKPRTRPRRRQPV